MVCEHLAGTVCVAGAHIEADSAERVEADGIYRREHFVAEGRLDVVGVEDTLSYMSLPVSVICSYGHQTVSVSS